MMPKINPKQMQQMMRQMGISQEKVDALEVIIHCKDKDIVIADPEVAKVHMMGQLTFQVSGNIQEHERQAVISLEDIQTVMAQAKVSQEEARKAIEDAGGDLAKAILTLTQT